MRRWPRRDDLLIVAHARPARDVAFWGDETSLRPDEVHGRGYVPRHWSAVDP